MIAQFFPLCLSRTFMALFYNSIPTSKNRNLEFIFKMDVTRCKQKFLKVAD